MGLTVGIKMHTDPSAAKGIATRRGVGKVKHLETRTLWVQDKVERGVIRMRKVSGETNRADMFTKYLSAVKLQSLMNQVPVYERDGRHPLAPKLLRELGFDGGLYWTFSPRGGVGMHTS